MKEPPKKPNYRVTKNDESLQAASRPREEGTYAVRARRREGEKNILGLPFIPRAVYTALILLVLCFVAVLVLMNAQGLSPENFFEWAQGKVLGIAPGSGYPLSTDGVQTGPHNFQLMDNEPVLLTDTTLSMYTRAGACISGRRHGFGTPALKVEGSRALLYDIGGTGCRVETRGAIESEQTMTQPIFTGALSRSGVYAVATAGDGFASVISVFSRAHEEMYTRSVQDYYISAMALRNDGALLAAGGVWSDEGQMGSTLLLLGFTDQTPVAKFDFSGTIILAVSFLDGGEIAVVGDRAAYLISSDYKTMATYEYSGRTLQGYSFSPSAGLALSATGDGGTTSHLAVLGRTGQVVLEKDVNRVCTDLYFTGNELYFLSQNLLIRRDLKRGTEKELFCPATAHSVLVSGTDAYLLGASELYKISAG